MSYKLKSLVSLGLLLGGYIGYWWWQPYFYSIDKSLFFLINKISSNQAIQPIFKVLLHRNESWVNIIIMLGLNVWGVYWYDQGKTKFLLNNPNCRDQHLLVVLYCWLSFQLVLLINYGVFQKILLFQRSSPSLIFNNFIRLDQIFNTGALKVYSDSSFPSGHALVVIYWLLFINLYANRWIKLISMVIGILLVLPRVISGAHWVSDIIFSILLAWFYFNLSMWFAESYKKFKKIIY